MEKQMLKDLLTMLTFASIAFSSFAGIIVRLLVTREQGPGERVKAGVPLGKMYLLSAFAGYSVVVLLQWLCSPHGEDGFAPLALSTFIASLITFAVAAFARFPASNK